jgi:hypothetical protein
VCREASLQGFHQKSFQLIIERWPIIWPEFKRVITDLMESYNQDAPDWSSVRTLYLHIPDEPLAEDAEWGIDVVFSSSDTLKWRQGSKPAPPHHNPDASVRPSLSAMVRSCVVVPNNEVTDSRPEVDVGSESSVL